jgi:hypothetical protein
MCRDELEARMRAVSEQFDKSVERKAKKPEFINFNKPGNYVIRVLPSRNYPADVQWFRKLDRHFIKPESNSDMLFARGYQPHDTLYPLYKAIKAATDGVQKDVAIGKFGKGSAKSSAKYLINVVTPDKQDIVQTAEVPQRFIKFLRTFQDMVNMLFCDPQHGNLLAFEAVPAANGFGNEYRIIYQLPMPTNFSGEQVPDLDELLKAAIGDIKPMAAFTGNLVAPLAATGPAPGGFQAPAPASIAPAGFGAAAPVPPAASATNAFGVSAPSNDAPFAGPFVQAPTAAAFGGFAATTQAAAAQQAAAPATASDSFAPSGPVAPPAANPATTGSAGSASVRGISDAEAEALKARLLAMIARDKARKKAGALKPVRR